MTFKPLIWVANIVQSRANWPLYTSNEAVAALHHTDWEKLMGSIFYIGFLSPWIPTNILIISVREKVAAYVHPIGRYGCHFSWSQSPWGESDIEMFLHWVSNTSAGIAHDDLVTFNKENKGYTQRRVQPDQCYFTVQITGSKFECSL